MGRDEKSSASTKRKLKSDGSRSRHRGSPATRPSSVDGRSSHSRSSKTSDSKTSKQKMQLMEADGTRILTPPLASPGVMNVSGSRSSKRKSSKFDNRHSRSSGSKQSKTKVRLAEAIGADIIPPSPPFGADDLAPTVEATAAPDVDEIEAARQQGRDEERNARAPAETNNVFLATLAPKENKGRKYAAFLFLVIATGVITWLLVPKASESLSQIQIFDPPTAEDCLAISEGKETADQNGTISNQFGVEMDFAVTADIDIEFLRKELAAKIQRDVLPFLVGCNIAVSVSISIENNIFVIENAVLKSISTGDPTVCRNATVERLCSFVYMELDVFSKDDDVLSEVLLGQIIGVFGDEALLMFLNLISSVQEIYFNTAFEILPTTLSPSKQEDVSGDGLPSQEICDAISNGTQVPGQESLVPQEYDIFMDVMLESESELVLITIELEQKLQSLLMPSLAGCDDNALRDNLILNALVDAGAGTNGTCLPESESPCYRYVIHLYIYIDSIISSADFLEEIMAKFREIPLVERLGLLSPFKRITIVEIISEATSTGPSVNPTWAPVTYPTTDDPTRLPLTVPSLSPTRASLTSTTTEAPTTRPTPIPIPQPVVGPTLQPTPGPTGIVTQGPTTRPTPIPTLHPVVGQTFVPTPSPTPPSTVAPSDNPTTKPSVPPTLEPSTSQPSVSPTAEQSSKPSVPPTLQPCFETNTELSDAVSNWFTSSEFKASVEAQYGLIEDWCLGPGVTSMEDLFKDKSTFNEDISNWDVSSVTTMQGMFNSASSFNQDLSSWDVSSVTNMMALFRAAPLFDGAISTWDVSFVTNMRNMFWDASSFNQDLSSWDVSSVSIMESMFRGASSLNQDLSSWDVSSVTLMGSVFQEASAFNQNL
ncbi:unnamed protein product [Cylindrotheca closterium]|uniref:BspA family leucine-rich repeat surface protein n=1 Tax=Cylindrotheca closterium TaxID=2856 RepID=A0AAD2CUY3_9STRA|nr:unnamed protein product [Cylindrotheca closterium]